RTSATGSPVRDRSPTSTRDRARQRGDSTIPPSRSSFPVLLVHTRVHRALKPALRGRPPLQRGPPRRRGRRVLRRATAPAPQCRTHTTVRAESTRAYQLSGTSKPTANLQTTRAARELRRAMARLREPELGAQPHAWEEAAVPRSRDS